MDFTFKICKQIQGYGLINQDSFALKVPPAHDAG